jgi:hypothetical protein
MKGTSMLMTEDSKRADGQEDLPQCDYTNSDTYVVGSSYPDCGQEPVVTLSDQNPAPVGATLIIDSTAIGQFNGPCLDNPQRPDNFCTDQESWGLVRGLPQTLPAVSGSAGAEVTNIFLGSTTDLAVCKCQNPSDFSCPASQCTGPLSVPGTPLPSCGQLLANPPTVSGVGLAAAFTALANPTIGDEVVTYLMQAGTWTTLATSISATDTTLMLVDASSFPSSGNVSIARAGFDSEEISYTGKSGNQLTGATRGIKGTTAAAHSAGEPVVW